MASAQTVLGLVGSGDLGITQTHEHLLIDLVGQTGPRTEDPDELARWEDPIALANVYDVRRGIRLFKANLQLTSVEEAVEELSAFARAGGSTIIDLTTIDLGRDPEALVQISRKTGIQIVMGTGFYVNAFHPPKLSAMSEDVIAGVFIRDLTEGTPEGVRAESSARSG